MKERVLSTYKILKGKAFNSNIDESWVDWAIEMIEAGYEADSLYQLAGILKPYNQFELQDLTSKVLNDLHLDFSDKPIVLRNYVYFLIKSGIDEPENHYKVLKELRDVYYEFDMGIEYQDFALLYWAKDDLIGHDCQYYWEGADKTNIDKIISEQFELYLNKFDNEVSSR